MPGRERNRPSETVDVQPAETFQSVELAELAIEETGFEATGGRELHPQLVAAVQKSWDNRVQKGSRVETPTSRLYVADADEARLRVRQLRDAGAHLNIGVAIKDVTYVKGQGIQPTNRQGDGRFLIRFRARKRRGADTTTAE